MTGLGRKQVEGLDEKRRERYITDKELHRLTDVMPYLPKQLIRCLYFTSQRVGRILSLRWSQVDLPERVIKFSRSTSNKKVPEVIWINDPLLGIFKELDEERRKRAIITPFVFIKHDGTPYKSIRKAWETACKRAGVQDARIHDIRHKAITDMAKAGIPSRIVQRAVGHSQSATTDRYTHLRVEDVKEAFEALK